MSNDFDNDIMNSNYDNYILDDIKPLESNEVDIAMPINSEFSSTEYSSPDLEHYYSSEEGQSISEMSNSDFESISQQLETIDYNSSLDSSITSNELDNVSGTINDDIAQTSNNVLVDESNGIVADSGNVINDSIIDHPTGGFSTIPVEEVGLDTVIYEGPDITDRDDFREAMEDHDNKRREIEENYYQQQSEIVNKNDQIMDEISNKYNIEREAEMEDYNSKMGQGALTDEQMNDIETAHNEKMGDIESRYNLECEDVSRETERQLNDLNAEYNRNLQENEDFTNQRLDEIAEQARQENNNGFITSPDNQIDIPSNSELVDVPPESSDPVPETTSDPSSEASPVSDGNTDNSNQEPNKSDKPNTDWGIEHTPSESNNSAKDESKNGTPSDSSTPKDSTNNNLSGSEGSKQSPSKNTSGINGPILDPSQLPESNNGAVNYSGNCGTIPSSVNPNSTTYSGSCGTTTSSTSSDSSTYSGSCGTVSSKKSDSSNDDSKNNTKSGNCGTTSAVGSNSITSPISSGNTTANSTFGNGNSKFSYFMEDDTIEYDYDAAKPIVQDLAVDLEASCEKLQTLVEHLSELQEHCHDIEGTNISEDYLDFASLIGDDAEGISGYILDATSLVENIYDTLEEWNNVTNG